MTAKQITLAEANAYVTEHHRHHDATWGHKFSLGAFVGEKLVGVAICGRPVGRKLDVQLPGDYCMNVSVAGSIVMYDRIVKRQVSE